VRTLIISAHPDDEVIGAGGTIARHVSNGDDMYWCIVTEAHTPPWPEGTLAAAREQVEAVRKLLGIRETFFCGFPTVELNTVPYRELCSALTRIIQQTQPVVVYTTPYEDINLDHRIVYDATLVATRPLAGNSVRRLLAYEISTTNRFGQHVFSPNVFVDISDFLNKKLEALACYTAELREFPHPRSLEGVELLARERGLSIGVRAAECFQLIREIL